MKPKTGPWRSRDRGPAASTSGHNESLLKRIRGKDAKSPPETCCEQADAGIAGSPQTIELKLLSLVEAAGVEPASGNDLPGVSTRLAGPFDLALRPPVRQGDARPACKSRQRIPGRSNDHPANRRPARFQREEEAADGLRFFTQPVQRCRWHLSLCPRFFTRFVGPRRAAPASPIPSKPFRPQMLERPGKYITCLRPVGWNQGHVAASEGF